MKTLGPAGPVEPAAPVAPVGPVGPVAPAEPVAPVAPVGPAAPLGPVGPLPAARTTSTRGGCDVVVDSLLFIVKLMVPTGTRTRPWFDAGVVIHPWTTAVMSIVTKLPTSPAVTPMAGMPLAVVVGSAALVSPPSFHAEVARVMLNVP